MNRADASLIAATVHLLERTGHPVPSQELLRSITNWSSIADINGFIGIEAVGVVGTWPQSNDAIILEQSPGESYIDFNGFERVQPIHTYYPVADWGRHLVFNTETGEIEPFIGRTVASWASFNMADKPPLVYDSSSKPATEEDYPGITYERFPRPRRMYVSKLEGANKVSFGKAANWNEIGKSVIGHVDYGTEIYILGQARHPMPPVGAVFYMDAAAMGAFSGTGRVAETVGYDKSDLHDHILAPTFTDEPQPEPEPESITAQFTITEPSTTFKDTYKAYRDSQGRPEIRRYVATNIPQSELFIEIVSQNGKEFEVQLAWVHDYETRLAPHKFRNRAEVDVAGTFWFGGKHYARPAKVVENGSWFGIDMDWLVLKSELYSTATTVPERKVLKTLRASDYVTIVREATLNKVMDVAKRRHRKINIK